MFIPKSIKTRLVRNYEVAASSNDAEAAFFLSACYGSGFGVQIDKQMMISWAVKAAEHGNMEAVKAIASQYDILRLPPSRGQLVPWLLKAAKAGHCSAMDQIAICYLYGLGVRQSFDNYVMWANKLRDASQASGSIKSVFMESVLHRAAREGNIDALRFLLQHENFDVNIKNDVGWTALHWAACNGYTTMVKILVDEFHDAGTIDGQISLHHAAAGGHTETVKLLTERSGADANAKTEYGRTPLHGASKHGHFDVIKLLINVPGIEIDAKSVYGRTPLHEAAENGHLEIVRLLAEHHADVDATTDRGSTPMLLAWENRHIKVIELLASEFAANINVKNKSGWTLLHYLARDGNKDAMRLHMGFGADANFRSKDGRTPLHEATENGHLEIVRLLAEHHVEIEDKD